MFLMFLSKNCWDFFVNIIVKKSNVKRYKFLDFFFYGFLSLWKNESVFDKFCCKKNDVILWNNYCIVKINVS